MVRFHFFTLNFVVISASFHFDFLHFLRPHNFFLRHIEIRGRLRRYCSSLFYLWLLFYMWSHLSILFNQSSLLLFLDFNFRNHWLFGIHLVRNHHWLLHLNLNLWNCLRLLNSCERDFLNGFSLRLKDSRLFLLNEWLRLLLLLLA